MKLPKVTTLIYGYVGFAVVNAGIAWLTSSARTGRMPGQNPLLDFNDSLLRLNLLAKFIERGATPSHNIAIPTGATVTQAPAGGAAQGTTTYFGDSTPPFLPN